MTAAKQAATTPEFEENADVSVTPSDWEFDTVREESPTMVIFDKHGESFIGKFVGKRHIDREPNAKGEDQSFDVYTFTGRDGAPYGLTNSYALVEAYEDDVLKPDTWYRVTYVKDIDRGTGKNAMKDLRIEAKK